jgi:16S rRNA (cytosine967-C5)-methyltransferase
MQLSSLLGHAQELLGAIRASSKPADSLIDSFFRSHKYLGSHDRRFIAESIYGTLRHLRRCEVILFQALGDTDLKINAEDGHLLLVVTYLAAFGKDKIIVADIIPKLSSPKLKERVPDLLAGMHREIPLSENNPIERLGIQYSYPDWMVQKVVDQFGAEEAGRILESLNEPAPLTLRVNVLKTTVDQCIAELAKQDIQATKTKYSPVGLQIAKRLNVFSLKAFQDGLFEMQDEGSQILPILVDPKPTAKVLDACAGAGGKSLGFAALMKNRGEIYASDTNGYRLKELKKRSRRAGAFNIRPVEVENLSDLADKYTGYFDIVFVDAPCSGLGTIRRNPGMKWSVTEETVREVSGKQAAILGQCANLVKPHGRLIYATCTLLKEENEDVVMGFLTKNPKFSLKIPETMLAQAGLDNARVGDFIKLMPHIHGADGFFCAMMELSE